MKLHQILLLLCMLSCGGTGGPSPVPPDPSGSTGRLKYLALGDSYTIGQSVSVDERWPVKLAGDLEKTGKPVATPDIIAMTGWTTYNLLNALDQNKPSDKYDLVSLLIGVNNQYQGRSIEEYRTQFHELLLRSITYAAGEPKRVFVLSIPDWGVTPYGASDREKIALDIDRFNAVAKEECEKQKVLFIDITGISRQALNDPAMIATDQLHFSGIMYQLWVYEAMPKVKALL
ncbi:SGNH/GDSL hydrolase family protein [Dyadobacter sp. MSC1_007]|jgi:lysophospholipase L1-like esterase|uniref:SGNH/GDSL hydrolase family protein n=1 Tax=Dyadobacter sp. MSC1_007 TaxID=2909264 RepID=UPI0020300052|nr:SGNH/GDSL hydrolase family protein [Dyadobacter sp. MSC1_007]